MNDDKFLENILAQHYTKKAEQKQKKEAEKQDQAANAHPLGKQRLEICKSCESYNAAFRMCNECHCLMPVKVILPFASCPKSKW